VGLCDDEGTARCGPHRAIHPGLQITTGGRVPESAYNARPVRPPGRASRKDTQRGDDPATYSSGSRTAARRRRCCYRHLVGRLPPWPAGRQQRLWHRRPHGHLHAAPVAFPPDDLLAGLDDRIHVGACVALVSSTYGGGDTGEESEAISPRHVRSGDSAVAITFERACSNREDSPWTGHTTAHRHAPVSQPSVPSGRLTLRAQQHSLTREVWC